MLFVLKAKIIKIVDEPIEVEASSLEEAKELIIEAINNGDIKIDHNQIINTEIEPDCESPYGHRWEYSTHESKMFCRYCGILEEDYKTIKL